MTIAVVIPTRFSEHGQLGEFRSTAQVYGRRRLVALAMLIAVVLVLLLGTGHVVANRGGAPAFAPSVRPATGAAWSLPVNTYVVQPGDTLWSIGERFHGQASVAEYVDSLASANGGADIQVSQALAVP